MRQIYNHTRRQWQPQDILMGLQYGIVYMDNKHCEFGFFETSYEMVPIEIHNRLYYLFNKNCCTVPLYWMNSSNCYTTVQEYADNVKRRSNQNFNYPIGKNYNFCKISIPKNIILNEVDPEFEYIKQYTMGLEYETSCGNIPWLDCLKYNLVPLYDGSITGHEYVTFPMEYKEFNQIQTHLELLKTYTDYDKDCSLHIHFGGFPVQIPYIKKLMKYWNIFQNQIEQYLPEWCYQVENYKSNGKAYNRPYPSYFIFRSFYERTTGNKYVEDDGILYQPNRFDEDEIRKWEVHGRYFNMNIMHLISGECHKTVEFRFLHPTHNYYEIKWYILLLAAFLNFVQKNVDTKNNTISIEKVLESTYPADVCERILNEGVKLNHLRKVQMSNYDRAGIKFKMKNFYLQNVVNLQI
ncbi:MAG: amidoligase family protein [Bacteroidales bacterium]|nr:amidoligase family protein [Candidatus Scybalousia scybalohippi]